MSSEPSWCSSKWILLSCHGNRANRFGSKVKTLCHECSSRPNSGSNQQVLRNGRNGRAKASRPRDLATSRPVQRRHQEALAVVGHGNAADGLQQLVLWKGLLERIHVRVSKSGTATPTPSQPKRSQSNGWFRFFAGPKVALLWKTFLL